MTHIRSRPRDDLDVRPGMFETKGQAARVLGVWLFFGGLCWAVIGVMIWALVRFL